MSAGEGFDVVFASLIGIEEYHDPLAPENVAWSRQHFALMAEGGVWGIPRSGLCFRKEGRRLVLFASMPWEEAMTGTITAEELAMQQAAEFEAVSKSFGAAGVEVVRPETEQRKDDNAQ
jgi:hypothetical protein